MKNKILLVAGATIATVVATTSVFADFGRGMLPQFSTEEKTKIEAMTQEERQTYFDTKKSEMHLKMEARESVIDKLLNGETLTADDTKVVEEIKTHRAEQKAKKVEMEAKRAQMQAIKTKLQNNETLSDEEQALIDEMKTMKQFGNKNFGKGFEKNNFRSKTGNKNSLKFQKNKE